ncbi:hypothetical protein DXG01_001001 [Tephrocybe rancida]|nr:hypothetical protein DXG01_001001 [Tephrocybe rancida]
MPSTSRPVSLIQPSTSRIESSLSFDHLTPLRRSISPPGSGHYTLKRFSYISELPAEESFVPRPRSILRSSSFNMGFGFKDKEKGKEKEKEREKGTLKTTAPTSIPSLGVPPPPAIQRPTTSHGLFSSLHKSKGLKKKRSLSSLLETASADPTVAGPSAPRASRARSSDAASTLATTPALSKGKRQTPEMQRLEEYRQMQLKPYVPKPARIKQKTLWARRHKMKVHTDYGACYMQAYDPILLENDRQADLLLRRLNPLENPSFHDYAGKEPVYVLDVGCGPGHWIIDAANYWKQTSITGVDMVDILLPEARDNDQIDFVQGNFLIFPWPFGAKKFDLVRMANLSLCIPYDKWELILSEVHRILNINGRLELIDDEILFPYAPPPASRPTSISVTDPQSLVAPVLARGTSFFEDIDDDDDDDDVASVNTESTLVSDGDVSSSLPHTRRHSSTFISDSYNGVAQLPVPVPPSSDLPNSPTSVVTVKADTAHSSLSEWNIEAASSKDMETVYHNMLHRKFGVHSLPSKFVPDIIQHVFGNAETKSYHLRLAPKNAEKEFARSTIDLTGLGIVDEKDEKVSGEPKKGSHRKAWFSGDPDKEGRRRKKVSKPSIPTGPSVTATSSLGPDSRIPEGLSAKAAGRLGITSDIPHAVTRVPENVSAKAALRLGIPMASAQMIELPSRLSTLSSDDTSSDESLTPLSSSPSSTPPNPVISTPRPPVPSPAVLADSSRLSMDSISSSPGDSKLSAKAAHRLGISYSALGEATASAKASTRRPVSSSSTLVSSPSPVQSPGLIVWPNQFIPMSPSELEMHALRNVHTLIGCKPALAEFVGSFLDEDGNRIQSPEDFDEALWMYECFRRRRFNWPADIPPDWDADSDTDTPDSTALPTVKPGTETSARSATLRNSMVLDITVSSSLDSASGTPYKPDELTNVRTIRVFEATKTDEYTLSTMKTPRSPPPSPPR